MADSRRNRPQLQRGDTMMTARRMAAAKYSLEMIKRDVCQWLSEILQLSITPQCFMETLDTGVVLCQLVELVQGKTRALKEAGGELGLKIPLEPIKYRPGAKKATFHARENTKHFLDWCRELGIRDDLIFETNGLVEHADEKRVLLCLLEVSRYAREVNIKPPDIISQEEGDLMEESGEKRDMLEMETVTPAMEDEAASNHDTPLPPVSGQSNGLNDSSKPSDPSPQISAKPVPSNSSGDQDIVQYASEGSQRGHSSRLLDYCSYPFLFSFLLLLFLLGGGLYLKRRK